MDSQRKRWLHHWNFCNFLCFTPPSLLAAKVRGWCSLTRSMSGLA